MALGNVGALIARANIAYGVRTVSRFVQYVSELLISE